MEAARSAPSRSEAESAAGSGASMDLQALIAHMETGEQDAVLAALQGFNREVRMRGRGCGAEGAGPRVQGPRAPFWRL